MTSAALELHRVRRTFGSLVAVDDVTLSVAAGERHALIGPNGAGKSTLFDLIAGALPVSGGRIRVAGAEVTRTPEHRRAAHGIARTFQVSSLFDALSARDNVAVAVQRRAGRGRSLLRHVDRLVDVDAASHEALERVGLGARASTPAGELSHGERRQLEVALALATEPTLLLLDEPTAGMSAAEARAFIATIGALPRDLTLVIVEHDMDVVFALAERISVLDAGRLLAVGPPDEVRRSPEVQRAYLGSYSGEALSSERSP